MLVAGLASAGLAAFGAVQAMGEIAPYMGSGYAIEDRFTTLQTGALTAGQSRFARVGFLNECSSVGTSLFGALQPQENIDKLADNCLAELRTMVDMAPTDGQAWTSMAEMYALKRDAANLRQAIIRSREGAPGLEVLAAQRLALTDAWIADPSDAEKAGRDSDLLVLLSSWNGTQTLAERYIARPEDRDAMMTLFQTAPADQQKRFLEAVQKKAAAQ